MAALVTAQNATVHPHGASRPTDPLRRAGLVAGGRVRRPDPGDAGAQRAAGGARARRVRADDDARRSPHAPGAPDADRDAPRRRDHVPRDALQLPLDGHHAFAALCPRARRATRRRARPRLSRSHLDGRRDVGPRPANPVRLRAARDVRATPAQGDAQARPRCDALPRGRPGRGGRRRQLRARGRPRPGGRPGGRPRARARQRLSRIRSRCLPGAASCAASWTFPSTSPIVLYVGRIASGKGIEHLLAVARELTDVHLVLVGPDDRHGAIDEVRAAETSGRVHALGATTEPPLHLYAEADVLCLPSAGESFGMAAAEAAAAGTPVVVTDRCGIAGFFREGEAIVVPYGAEELADAVRDVLGNSELRRSLAAGGVAAARRMSWEHVTAHQEEIYREAIASRQASTSSRPTARNPTTTPARGSGRHRSGAIRDRRRAASAPRRPLRRHRRARAGRSGPRAGGRRQRRRDPRARAAGPSRPPH